MAARDEHKITTVVALSIAASTVLAVKGQVSDYRASSCRIFDDRRLISKALQGAYLRVIFPDSLRDKAARAWACHVAMWSRCNWQWILIALVSASNYMLLLRCGKELPYLPNLFGVVQSDAEKRSLYDGFLTINIPTPRAHRTHPSSKSVDPYNVFSIVWFVCTSHY